MHFIQVFHMPMWNGITPAQETQARVLAGSQVILGRALHSHKAPSSMEDLEKGPKSLNPHYMPNLNLKEAHGVITPMALGG